MARFLTRDTVKAVVDIDAVAPKKINSLLLDIHLSKAPAILGLATSELAK